MDLSKLLHGFDNVFSWICQSCSMYFSPFAKQNQDEVWPRFQSLLKLRLWTKGVEWIKALNAFAGITSKCIWARNKGGNDFYCFTFDGSQVAPKDNLVPKKTTHRLLRQPGQPPDGGSWPCPWSSCQWSEPTQDQASHFGIGGEKPREAGPPPSPGRTRGNHCQAFVHN